MSDGNQERLEQAYELIRQEQFDEAQAVLQPLLFSDPDADVWWLWANAVTEPDDARHALNRVLELDPEHLRARQYLDSLNQLYPPALEPQSQMARDVEYDTDAEFAAEPELVGQPEPLDEAMDLSEAEAPIKDVERVPASEAGSQAPVDFSDWLEDFADVEDAAREPDFLAAEATEPVQVETAASTGGFGRAALVLLLLLVVVVGAYIVLQRQGIFSTTVPAPTDTPQVAAIIVEPSESVAAVLEAAQQAADAEAPTLGGIPTVQLEQRGDDRLLVVRVCRPAGSDISSALESAMMLAARYGVSAGEEISKVGVELVNCDRDDTLISAAAPASDAAAFAAGETDFADFRSVWELDS